MNYWGEPPDRRMLHWPHLITLAVVLLLLIGVGCLAPASAQEQPRVGATDENGQLQRPPCHDAGEIQKRLARKYGETPVASGLQTNGNLLQVYASEETGTWTVVSVSPNGVGCIVAAGEDWGTVPKGQMI